MDKQYTRQEIYDNRMKWINFLRKPGRKKAVDYLDLGEGKRCCLGHGCYVLKLPKQYFKYEGEYRYDGESRAAPQSFVDMVGLHRNYGAILNNSGDKSMIYWRGRGILSLVHANDTVGMSPQKIGEFLMEKIEGGPLTPFISLDEYPETIK